jgi:hypothetical protein
MVTLSLTAFLLAVWSSPCHAAESAVKEFFTDSIYGGFAGTLVGGAVMAFAFKPENPMGNLGYGSASRVIAGAASGLGRALAQLDSGRVKFSMPTIIPDRQESNFRGQSGYVFTTELIRGRF